MKKSIVEENEKKKINYERGEMEEVEQKETVAPPAPECLAVGGSSHRERGGANSIGANHYKPNQTKQKPSAIVKQHKKINN